MREILFRGKTEKGEWVYWNELGVINFDLTDIEISLYAHLLNDELMFETIGQFTGLTDKNGKKIFEGDIVRVCKDSDILQIIYNERGYFCASNNAWWEFIDELGSIEIIGNIHDNPELLKEHQ